MGRQRVKPAGPLQRCKNRMRVSFMATSERTMVAVGGGVSSQWWRPDRWRAWRRLACSAALFCLLLRLLETQIQGQIVITDSKIQSDLPLPGGARGGRGRSQGVCLRRHSRLGRRRRARCGLSMRRHRSRTRVCLLRSRMGRAGRRFGLLRGRRRMARRRLRLRGRGSSRGVGAGRLVSGGHC